MASYSLEKIYFATWLSNQAVKKQKYTCTQIPCLGLMQYSLKKDHQHHKWQPPRSWISFPDCQVAQDKQADAVSAYTQVKMEDAHKLLKIPKSECPDIWIRLPRHTWQKSWSSMEDRVVPSERDLHGHSLAGLLWERQFEKILLKYGWEKVSGWECFFVHREKGLLLSVYVDDIKLAGKKQNIYPMWKVLMKDVDLGEPTSFFDHVYLGCTERECDTSKDIVDNTRNMFDSKISAGTTEKLPYSEKLGADISSWSYDMEGDAKKFVERYCELANKTTQQLYKVTTPCFDDHQFKEEEMGSVGDLSKVCSQIVLKCLCLAPLGVQTSMVCKQTCTSSHKMDQSLWQTLCSFVFLEYLENLYTTKNQSQRTLKQLFDVTKTLVRDQKEIQGISMIDWQQKSLEKDDSVDWPGSSVINSESLRILRFTVVHGQNRWKSR